MIRYRNHKNFHVDNGVLTHEVTLTLHEFLLTGKRGYRLQLLDGCTVVVDLGPFTLEKNVNNMGLAGGCLKIKLYLVDQYLHHICSDLLKMVIGLVVVIILGAYPHIVLLSMILRSLLVL